MTTPPFKLILTDIDGTILPFGCLSVSKRCATAMQACIDAGIHVGPASGRSLSEVRLTFKGYEELCRTALASCGMQVFADGKLIHEATYDARLLVRVSEVCARHADEGVAVIILQDGTAYILQGTEKTLRTGWPDFLGPAVLMPQVPDFPVVKVDIMCPSDIDYTRFLCEELKREIPELDFVIPLQGFLNVSPRGQNKGTAIDILCRYLGISLDEVCCFGDSDNDVEMLKHVRYSVAVSNATDAAKAVANFVIGSVDDEAVPEAMERIARGENPFV